MLINPLQRTRSHAQMIDAGGATAENHPAAALDQRA
jgi:hypothetical protein